MSHLVAAVLVEQHQHQRHDDDDSDHDGGVQDGVQRSLGHRVRLLWERRVDPGSAHNGGRKESQQRKETISTQKLLPVYSDYINSISAT